MADDPDRRSAEWVRGYEDGLKKTHLGVYIVAQSAEYQAGYEQAMDDR